MFSLLPTAKPVQCNTLPKDYAQFFAQQSVREPLSQEEAMKFLDKPTFDENQKDELQRMTAKIPSVITVGKEKKIGQDRTSIQLYFSYLAEQY